MAKKIRLDRLLANMGYGSRKEVGRAVKERAFQLGDRVITDISYLIDPDCSDGARFFDEPLDPASPLTILLHKPRGYTCSSDEDGLLVYDLLPPRWKLRDPILSTAGRLDKDSTGLVLMTDDGQLLHKIISPKTHVEKEYHVTLRDPLTGEEAGMFATGTFCLRNDPKPLKPAIWKPSGEKTGTMILQEGRYHQIRRMFGAVGNHVETLHRVRLAGLVLENLDEGKYRVLDQTDMALLFKT